jgi:uncharacterized protein
MNRRTPDKTAADDDVGGLDEIESSECWALLATQPVGRVAVIAGHYPLVFPVNFAVDGHSILYRTGVGTKLHSVHYCNVSFQVDGIDPVHRSGWSVLVKGVARVVNVERRRDEAIRAEAAGARPWAPGLHDYLVCIPADHISGRRIRLPDPGPPGDLREYL